MILLYFTILGFFAIGWCEEETASNGMGARKVFDLYLFGYLCDL